MRARKPISKNYSFVLLVSLTAFMSSCSHPPQRPNVVLIVVDTLRADHLPFHGYEMDTAPFLDKIASESAVFERAFAASSWTAPSTASILTSLYPFQHGVVTGMEATQRHQDAGATIEISRIPDSARTIAEVFRQNGYRTFAVADNINICEAQGFDQGFDKFKYFAYETADVVNAKLLEWEAEIKGGEPYFLYIHYNDPHRPYNERAPWYRPENDRRKDTLSRYDSEIRYLDEKIEEMFHLFDWSRKTLVILTADHGESFWEHRRGYGHGSTLYNVVIHVPLFFYFPPEDRAGRRIPHNVTNLDIIPTVSEYLGLGADEDNAGMSLMPLVRGSKEKNNERYIYSHLYRMRPEEGHQTSRATVYDNWKFIQLLNGDKKLFDLVADPREQENQIGRDPEVAETLEEQFLRFENASKKYPSETLDYYLSRQELERLKALGYVR